MNIYFRADASVSLGFGHVMRCLTLATELKSVGKNVVFLCRNLSGHLAGLIKNQGFAVELLSQSKEEWDWQLDFEATRKIVMANTLVPEWMIVDHYSLDWQWETAVRPYCQKIMVIDDLANRRHCCDLLLDQNYYIDMFERYRDLVPGNCRLLLGPQYVLLRPEFHKACKKRTARDGIVRRILISFGGSDPTNETCKALYAIESLQLTDVIVDVVVGSSAPNLETIKEICSRLPTCIVHCQVNYIAELMVQADLAIGAGGSSCWERCYLGLPTMAIVVADNQNRLVHDLAEYGAIIHVGGSRAVTVDVLAEALKHVLDRPVYLRSISQKCLALMAEHNPGALISALVGDKHI